jgi:AcrR family transcriptional regulator
MTKEKILSTSSRLFFEKGIANVRLQHIADSVNISVGNLAYHYPNKQAIVRSVYSAAFNELNEKTEQLFAEHGLKSFDESIKTFFRFQANYNFCFNNAWEISRNYPELHQQWKIISNRLQWQIQKKLLSFSDENLFIKEPFKSAYKILAEHILLHLLCWMSQQSIKNKPASYLSFRRATWALLYPYFTDNGKQEYKNLGIE